MANEPSRTWTKPWLILCEGRDDLQFFGNLLRKHKLADKFDVQFPAPRENEPGGNSKFGSYLLTQIETTRGEFVKTVKAVLIVSDNDQDCQTSFANIVQTLKDAKTLPVPTAERRVARRDGSPDIVVLMLPMGTTGNLESVCVTAACNKWGLQAPLEAYIASAPATNWPATKQAKARLHSLLAVTCESKPETSFANHWQEKPDFHIPLDDACFTDIVTFLKSFENVLKGDDD